mmetsp:Transcript_61397/g.155078  ORF Transcript_61397/g.155078 Transcript_61397/m.155078 type:complete len:732 (+) Transcript_61397:41-2236(+)
MLPQIVYRCCRWDETAPLRPRPCPYARSSLVEAVLRGSSFPSPYIHTSVSEGCARWYRAHAWHQGSWVCQIDTSFLQQFQEGIHYYDLSTSVGRDRWLRARDSEYAEDMQDVDRARELAMKDAEFVIAVEIPTSAIQRVDMSHSQSSSCSELDRFFHPCSGLVDEQGARSLMKLYQTCPSDFAELAQKTKIIERAVAGKRSDVAAVAASIAVSDSVRMQAGQNVFGVKPLRGSLPSLRLFIKIGSLDAARAAGVDLRTVKVDPCVALRQAISQQRCFEWKLSISCTYFDIFGLQMRPRMEKWRDGQTLLQMAILCGQLDATKYLCEACCEATSLSSSDLSTPWFVEDHPGPDERRYVYVNENAKCPEAARLAYHVSKSRYQLVIFQMAGWWSRLQPRDSPLGLIGVKHIQLVNRIAAFALAVPPLPEMMRLPPPFGFRRAEQRAARRARHALAAVVPRSSPKSPRAKACVAVAETAVEKADGESPLNCIQDIVNDLLEKPTVIAPEEAEATARALWEAGVELEAKRLCGAPSTSEAAVAAEVDMRHPSPQDVVFLGKLNRMPKQVREMLSQGASLRPLREALATEGLSWKLVCGTMVFVHPWQYQMVMEALNGRQLHPDHVVFAQSVEYLVEEVLARCKGTWMRSRDPMASSIPSPGSAACSEEVASDAGMHGSEAEPDMTAADAASLVDWELKVVRTFLCCVLQDSTDNATVSTTALHCPNIANPRRCRA